MIKSFNDLVENITSGGFTSNLTDLEIIGKDDDLLQITGRFNNIDISIQGLFHVSEDGTLTIDGVDFSGEIGVKGILNLVDEFGKAVGAYRIIINPGKRTTGANPGKIPPSFERDIEY